MKFFTKSMLTLAMMAFGIVAANANVLGTDLKDLPTANGGTDAWKQAMQSLTYPLEVKDVVLFGSDAGSAQTSAKVSSYDYMYLEVTDFVSARPLRIFFWNGSALVLHFLKPVADKETANYAQSSDVTGNGTYCVKIPEGCTLQGAKTPWTQNPASTAYYKISQIYLTESADPLASVKAVLTDAIKLGEMQNPNFKTSLSWSKLQDAIAAGQAALNKADVTEEELVNAKEAVNNAINGLELFQGYTKLTKDAFKKYTSITEPGEGTAVGCAYDINVSTGMPYGDSNVSELNWADLAAYDKLVIITSTGTPRIMLNRIVAGGNIATTKEESKMIDINQNTWVNPQCPWAAEAYQTKDESGKIFTIDLKKIVDDWGFARLHSIKGQNGGNVTVTDMLLFKAPASTTDDPAVVVNLMSLQNAIDKANAIDLTTKTKESAKKVKNAVLAAQDLMAQSNPSLIDLENARRAILQAIDELVDAPVIADGVYDLKGDMFLEWTGIDEDAEPTETTIGCAYEVGTGEKGAGTTMFGNPSVVWKTYADLSAYDHLLIVGTPGLQLRVLFNRLEVGNGGGDGNGGALTELNPTIGEDGLVDVDLKAENLNGAARLNAIKLGWGSPAGQFTKLQVVKGAYDPVAVGLQTVKAAAENGAIFNLGGQRLAKPVKGLNIINGKKVVIK